MTTYVVKAGDTQTSPLIKSFSEKLLFAYFYQYNMAQRNISGITPPLCRRRDKSHPKAVSGKQEKI